MTNTKWKLFVEMELANATVSEGQLLILLLVMSKFPLAAGFSIRAM